MEQNNWLTEVTLYSFKFVRSSARCFLLEMLVRGTRYEVSHSVLRDAVARYCKREGYAVREYKVARAGLVH